MSYVDLDSIHVPAAGTRPPASWGLQVNENFDQLNTEFIGKLGAWTSYVPAWTQSVPITKSITYARYLKVGRLVIAQGVLVATSAGTANNPITVTLQIPAVQTLIPVGHIWWVASGIYYDSPAVLGTTTSFVGVIRATGLNLGQTSTGWDNQVASGDTYAFAVQYESAS